MAAPLPVMEPLLTFIPNETLSAPTPKPPPATKPPYVQSHSIRVSFSADAEFHKLMLRACALLRHKYPDGRLEGVLKDALVALLKRRDRGFGWAQARQEP
jgi:hypothetical protein